MTLLFSTYLASIQCLNCAERSAGALPGKVALTFRDVFCMLQRPLSVQRVRVTELWSEACKHGQYAVDILQVYHDRVSLSLCFVLYIEYQIIRTAFEGY